MAGSASARETEGGGSEASRPLAGRTVLGMPYSHMDWAWCFTRSWHHARYTAIFDEALRRAAEDSSFCLFVDSLAESLEPYFAERPESRSAWNELAAAGRVAVVGGQYANVRPATAPEEVFLRNLEIGRRTLARLLPAARPLGYANLDTGIGPSQLPQVLSLAGFRYLLAGRPEEGLAADGVPAVFRWRGADGRWVLVLVQHYGVCTDPFLELGGPDPARRERALGRLADRLLRQCAAGARTLGAILGADDMRYLRDPITDSPCDTARLLSEWARRHGACVRLATPDELARRLASQAEDLPCLAGPVDACDVAYNGPFGQSGLRELRDRTAAALVEAEAWDCLAAAAGASLPRLALGPAWRACLRAHAHATQYLFAEDAEELRLDLALACRQAQRAREAALERIAPAALPQDSPLCVLVNPLPWPRECTVSLPVLRTDFGIPGYRVRAVNGSPVPQQTLASPNRRRPGEWPVLVRVALPACGCRVLEVAPAAAEDAVSRGPAPLPLTGSLSAGSLTVAWEDGLLTGISSGETRLTASPGVSLLEPSCRPIQTRGWLTTAIGEPGLRLETTAMAQSEWGPLRWCLERVGRLGPHRLRQWFYLCPEGRVEVVTEIDYAPENAFFGLALPCPAGAALTASVPFGVEARKAAPAPAPGSGSQPPFERLVRGVFYARDWVRVESPPGCWALAVLEGDRYWLCRSEEERLEHLLMRATEPLSDGWEQFTAINRPGHLRFRHGLLLGKACDPAALSAFTDEARFPVRVRTARACALPDGLSLARVEGGTVRVLSWRRLGRETELRLVESAGQPAQVTLRLEGAQAGARLVDLRGRRLTGEAAEEDGPGRIRLPIGPWQIRTLRFRQSGRRGPEEHQGE